MIHTNIFIHYYYVMNQYWHQLEFVKHRDTRDIQHYAQYDDVAGIEEEGDKLSKMYKSQEGRLPDY